MFTVFLFFFFKPQNCAGIDLKICASCTTLQLNATVMFPLTQLILSMIPYRGSDLLEGTVDICLIIYSHFFYRDKIFLRRFLFRSFVYLSNLLYAVPLEQKAPIVSDSGDIQGHLVINVEQCTGISIT